MVTVHAQGWENDTVWLNSKRKPYKFSNRATSEILGRKPLRTPKGEAGLAKAVPSVWEGEQSPGMGPEEERKGAREHHEERGPWNDQSCHQAARNGVAGVRIWGGGQSMPVYSKRAAKGLASNQR